jgi:hypothetical protein
MQILQQLLF